MKIKETKEPEEAVFGQITKKPFWVDRCGHPKNSYVGSLNTYDHEKLDVYIFVDKFSKKQQVCIRYGNQGCEYYSPGTLDLFLVTTHAGRLFKFKAALSVLESFGKIVWKRNRQKK